MKRIILIITLSFPLFLFAEIIVVKTKSLHSLDENSDSIQNFLFGYMDLFNDFFPVNLREVRAVNE